MNNKPTFGAAPASTPEQLAAAAAPKQELRPEIGAIWERTSKTNSTFFNIRLNKSKLQELLTAAQGDEVTVNLVAFANQRKENETHPSFRVFEDKKR